MAARTVAPEKFLTFAADHCKPAPRFACIQRTYPQMKRCAQCLILVLMVLDGCSGMPTKRAEGSALPVQSQAILYVARRGWHIDIGFGISDLGPPLAAVAADFPAAQYVFFGFGDRRYLLARHKSFPSLLAALWPGEAMVLATSLAATPEEAFGAVNVVRLRLSVAQVQAVRDFVWNSLIKANGTVRFYAAGPSEERLYYAAIPAYSAVHTCNTWVAEALQTTGLPIRSAGVVFAAQLWRQVRRIEAAATTKNGMPAAHAAVPYRPKISWRPSTPRVGSTPLA